MASFVDSALSRRQLLTSAAAAGATIAAIPAGSASAQPKARYTRYDVASAEGKEMLKSYRTAVNNLAGLQPTDPRNWFRNAFVHAMDCPHMNWWFLVWHRGFIGWFERILRDASGNPDFAIPYWDWTAYPTMPEGMFEGALNPSNAPIATHIKDFQTFYNTMNPAMEGVWKRLNPEQRKQLNDRMMPDLGPVGKANSLWWWINGGHPGDGSWFQRPQYARYLTAANPGLDEDTKKQSDPNFMKFCMSPIEFDKFNSPSADTHNKQPSPPFDKAIGPLEGFPHNLIHNYIGGQGYVPQANVGFMTNNLSPVDPIFFLHHSNMDRLWDIWTRRQQHLGLPWLPPESERGKFESERFLHFVDPKGNPVAQTHARDYLDMSAFDYGYGPGGWGEDLVTQPPGTVETADAGPFAGKSSGNQGTVAVSNATLQRHTVGKAGRPLVVKVTVSPSANDAVHGYDVLVNAPPNTTSGTPADPYYAGTISWVGAMHGMGGGMTFVLPLPANLPPSDGPLRVQVVPRHVTAPRAAAAGLRAAAQPAPVLKAVSVTAW